jgi:hypothetical protein
MSGKFTSTRICLIQAFDSKELAFWPEFCH